MTIAVLSLVGILIALYLTLYKVGIVGNLSCTIGSCETVNTSRWATFAGLPVAAWGLAAYVALFALAMAGTHERYDTSREISWLLVAISGWSVVFSGWLTYLELFVIRAICIWCVASALLMVAIFVASVVDLRGGRRDRRDRGARGWEETSSAVRPSTPSTPSSTSTP
jgi:uncharacterized membrane protein